ncbi:GNAT family N-acetyltransferase [Streptomyces sp. NPDC101237]|uniref:GNAT family N-acetyltransferase n=1 Tax=Streptomyces sp. NPDC101237 TaxID=3366139 RepID=UPI0038116E2C
MARAGRLPVTAEDSVCVRAERHGLGIGSALLAALVAAARESGHHAMIAGVEAENTASVRLHRRFGFEHAGTGREVGVKSGRRLDLTLMRLPLGGDGDTPGGGTV